MDPYLKMLMAMESGGQNIINHSGATSATGLYGFTKPAFKQVQIDNPELRNVTWEQFQQTPDIQHTFAAKLKDSVTNRMSTKGIPVTPLNVYKYWFLGPAGAETFLNKPPETPLSQAMSPEAIAANPWVNKFQTVGGLSAELNRRIGQKVNMETPAQQTAQPSFAQLEAALAKARAANNPVAVEKLTKMLQEPLAQARVRALEAGNDVAANKIIQRMQALGFDPTVAAPAPVAPPGQTQITEAPGPDTLGTPSQPADYDPSQRDMGGLGTPAAAPEAPVAPVAAPVAPTPELSPAAAPAAPVAAPAAPRPPTTAELVSGSPAPVTTLPTTTVTAGPKRNLTDSGFESDPTWIGNAKRIYQETEGKPFEGGDADAAKWLKNYVAQTKWNMGSAGLTIYDAMNKLSPEGKQALLQSIKEYGDAPTSGESVLRGLKGIATDPTTYLTAGVGNLITKTVGKKAAEVALRKAIEEGIKKQTLSTATKQAAASGAAYGAAGNALDQGVQVAADGQESIDPTQLATSAAGGAVVGAGASKIIDKLTGRGAVRNFSERSGNVENAKFDAEITRDLTDMATFGQQSPKTLQAIDANALARKYTSQAEEAINKLDPQVREPLLSALRNGRALNKEEQEAVLNMPGGREVLDIVYKADRVRTLTAQEGAKGGVLGTIGRQAVNMSPAYMSALAGYPVPVTIDMLKAITNKLGGKTTRAEAIADTLAIPNKEAADTVGKLLGPSVATDSIEKLRQMAAQAVTDRTARIEAAKQARSTAAKAADNPNIAISELQGKDPTYILGLSNPFGSPKNEDQIKEFSNVIRRQMESRVAKEKLAAEAAERAKAEAAANNRNSVLQATGMPLGGPFQELLQGGRSGLNLTTDQAVEALRIAANKNKGNPIGEAANQVRRSSPEGVTDTNAFYGLQNELRKLQERGVLGGQPGALSEVTQGSGIRNPISYAANVRTAEAALKVAQESAPNNALAQFANVVARTKSPEAKAALVQQRLLKATDQAEIDYLTNFIEPLTRFGAKSK